MIRAAVIAVLMLTAAVTGAVAFDHCRPKTAQEVILQPIHTVERIVERHTASVQAKAQGQRKPRGKGAKPSLGRRLPGDDTANELNRRELR